MNPRFASIPRARAIQAAACAVLAALIGTFAPAAAAQEQATPGDLELYDEAFRATYDNPADVPTALNFAKVAALQGDLEGAIGALERVLIFNPEIAEVDLELALLYRALGSLDIAKVYLQAADPERLSADDRALRERTLAELDRALARHKLSGLASIGLRYQTNANAGAISTVRLAGGALAPNSVRARADTDAFATVIANHSYDLGDQAGTSWDSRLLMYGTRQFRRHLLNVALLEVDSGPRFRLAGAPAGSPTLRPYLVGNALELGGAEYFVSGGGGADADVRLAPDWLGGATVEARQFKFNNSSNQPIATNKNAGQVLGRLLVNYAPGTEDLVGVGFHVLNYDARQGFETYKEVGASGNYTHRFAAPWTWSEQPWSAMVSAAYATRWYDHRDPSIDPGHLRRDNEWDLAGALTIGLADRVDFRLEVQQIWAHSTVALYHYRNTAVLGTVELRF